MAGEVRTEVSIDIGGTFTDVTTVASGVRRISKVLSTPADYGIGFEEALLEGVGALGATDAAEVGNLYHGTTIATNMVLTRSGARTALVTTAGFRDVLEMRRLRTPVQYSLLWRRPEPLVPRELRFELVERLAHDGAEVAAVDRGGLDELVERVRASGVESVAVCLLHSYINGAHERQVADTIRKSLPNVRVCCSSEIMPRPGEYERTSTAVVNSYLLPGFLRYSESVRARLEGRSFAGPLWLMESAGTLSTLREVRSRPVSVLESGPAGGVVGAAAEAGRLGISDLVTLDIGGTTAKACLIQDGAPSRSPGYEVGGEISTTSRLLGSGGYAISFPTLEIAEIGAGGGSIVSVDRSGRVSVGPESAGADPGPACYGRGGSRPTLTDAHVVLGRIPDGQMLGGRIRVDRDAAVRALRADVANPLTATIEAAAQGALELANVQMLRILRGVTIERGADPRKLALFAYGGMAGLHAAELAVAMGIETVLIPMGAGVFSSYGLMKGAQTLRRSVPVFAPIGTLVDPRETVLGVVRDVTAATPALAAPAAKWTAWVEVGFVGHDHGIPVPVEFTPSDPSFGEAVLDTVRSMPMDLFGGANARLQVCTLSVEGSLPPSAGATGESRFEERFAAERSEHRVYWGAAGWCPTRSMSVTDVGASRIQGPLLLQGFDYSVAVPPSFTVFRDEGRDCMVIERA